MEVIKQVYCTWSMTSVPKQYLYEKIFHTSSYDLLCPWYQSPAEPICGTKH